MQQFCPVDKNNGKCSKRSKDGQEPESTITLRGKGDVMMSAQCKPALKEYLQLLLTNLSMTDN